jgi:hypothetical protein
LTTRILKTAGVVALSMTLTACYGGGDMGECIDQDNDGYCEGVDCNDMDATKTNSCDEESPTNMDVME